MSFVLKKKRYIKPIGKLLALNLSTSEEKKILSIYFSRKIKVKWQHEHENEKENIKSRTRERRTEMRSSQRE